MPCVTRLHTYSKCGVPPCITQPNAITAFTACDCTILVTALTNSTAPGTVIISWRTPAASNNFTQPFVSSSVISLFHSVFTITTKASPCTGMPSKLVNEECKCPIIIILVYSNTPSFARYFSTSPLCTEPCFGKSFFNLLNKSFASSAFPT